MFSDLPDDKLLNFCFYGTQEGTERRVTLREMCDDLIKHPESIDKGFYNSIFEQMNNSKDDQILLDRIKKRVSAYKSCEGELALPPDAQKITALHSLSVISGEKEEPSSSSVVLTKQRRRKPSSSNASGSGSPISPSSPMEIVPKEIIDECLTKFQKWGEKNPDKKEDSHEIVKKFYEILIKAGKKYKVSYKELRDQLLVLLFGDDETKKRSINTALTMKKYEELVDDLANYFTGWITDWESKKDEYEGEDFYQEIAIQMNRLISRRANLHNKDKEKALKVNKNLLRNLLSGRVFPDPSEKEALLEQFEKLPSRRSPVSPVEIVEPLAPRQQEIVDRLMVSYEATLATPSLTAEKKGMNTARRLAAMHHLYLSFYKMTHDIEGNLCSDIEADYDKIISVLSKKVAEKGEHLNEMKKKGDQLAEVYQADYLDCADIDTESLSQLLFAAAAGDSEQFNQIVHSIIVENVPNWIKHEDLLGAFSTIFAEDIGTIRRRQRNISF